MKKKEIKLAIIGLGYVGLPLCIEFGKKRKVIGFDLNKKRIENLKKNIDDNKEFNKLSIKRSKKTFFTSRIEDLKEANCFIVAVPTPVTKNLKPDLSFLVSASKIVGKLLKKNDIVIYESTVFPGCTEEYCVPVLEKFSKLKFKQDFHCGYSPERINPGDKIYTISKIKKIVSASNKKTLNIINNLYLEIIKAGTHLTSSIKIAESAKVIENIQRDINIALMNELSVVFQKLKIPTSEVIKAASSKWNFLKFEPGLVGGHCINVDPYYMAYIAKKNHINTKIILAGRSTNDNVSILIVKKLLEKMKEKKINFKKSKILILGFSFKENVSDHRNTQIIKIYNELKKKILKINIYDPHCSVKEVKKKYKIKLENKLNFEKKYDAILVAVKHKKFFEIKNKIKLLTKENSVVFDVKNFLPKNLSDITL